MRMLHRRSRRFPMILENQNVPETLVVFQVQHAVPVSPQHVFHRALRERGQCCRVIRRFDHHLVGADSVHLVEQPFAFAVKIPFDSQRRKFVRHHAQLPTRRVRAAAVPPVHQHFRRRLGLIPCAERTILRLPRDHTFAQKIIRPLSAFRRNNHPSTRNRVFAQLRQLVLLDSALL